VNKKKERFKEEEKEEEPRVARTAFFSFVLCDNGLYYDSGINRFLDFVQRSEIDL
jgi:hypothetical protein